MMKHIWIGFLVSLLGSTMAFSQVRDFGGRRFDNDRIESLRTAHFTEVMGLRTKDAQVFWPWFNEREMELKAIRERKSIMAGEMQQAMSGNDEGEIERILDAYANLKFKEAQVQRAYHDKLKELLPIRKAVMFYQAEISWERKLIAFLKRTRDRRN